MWQTDFSEFETQGGGTWRLSGVCDYVAKVAFSCRTSMAQTVTDAIASLEEARDRAAYLLGAPLIEDLVDYDTGELTPIILVSDNGPAYKAAGFDRYISSRAEFRHIRTRRRSPHTNGVVERFFGSVKYEHLYR